MSEYALEVEVQLERVPERGRPAVDEREVLVWP